MATSSSSIDHSSCWSLSRAESHGATFSFDLQLFDEVVVEESKWNTKGRNIILNISKKDKDRDEHWPRLTKEKTKNPHIQIDWSRWVDEDEEDEKPPTEDFDPSGMNDFNMGDMANMMGGGGMGGMGQGDSDDEEEEEQEESKKEEGKEEETGEKKGKADLGDLDEDAE